MLPNLKFKQSNLLSDSILDAQIAQLFDSFIQPKAQNNYAPPLDVLETSTAFVLKFSLPGFKKDDLKIEIEKNYLLLQGERHVDAKKEETKQHLVESFYGKFSRKIQLPELVDTVNIEAELNEGILTLIIPKTELKQNKTQVVIR